MTTVAREKSERESEREREREKKKGVPDQKGAEL